MRAPRIPSMLQLIHQLLQQEWTAYNPVIPKSAGPEMLEGERPYEDLFFYNLGQSQWVRNHCPKYPPCPYVQ